MSKEMSTTTIQEPIPPFGGWPSKDCKPVLHLREPIEAVRARVRSVFGLGQVPALQKDDADDGLGPYSAFHVKDGNLGFVVFMSYLQPTPGGTRVFVDDAQSAGLAADRLIEVLGYTPADIIWLHPDSTFENREQDGHEAFVRKDAPPPRDQGRRHALKRTDALARVNYFTVAAFLVGALTSIVAGVLQSYVVSKFPAFIVGWRHEVLIATPIVVLGFITSFVVWRARQTLRRISRANERGFHVAAEFSKVLVRLTEQSREVQRGRGNDTDDPLEKFLQDQEEALTQLLDHVAAFFSDYTEHKCHASLKLFGVRGNIRTDTIFTALRDDGPGSKERLLQEEKPNYYRQPYTYRENTAFSKIMLDPEAKWYVNNNLVREAQMGRYQNVHKGWERYYTATLVVPITDQFEPSRVGKGAVAGFLCVDNAGGGFDEHFCANVAFAFARLTFGIMEILRQAPVPIEGDTGLHSANVTSSENVIWLFEKMKEKQLDKARHSTETLSGKARSKP